jgi:ATP-dependent exoDNAse (exonuclease V) alpha subunit
MLLKNIPERNLANGSRGVVSGFTDDNLPIVTFIDGQSLIVEWHTLTKMARRGIDERGDAIKDKASLTYIPLRLAYAITINKSQGITLDSAYLSLDTCFAPGHIYVALSRCRSMKNIYIKSWSMHAFNKCKPLQCVHDFYEQLEASS